MPKKKPDELAIGKFDILATYTYAKALLDGELDSEAKERGMVAAIMGAKARMGHYSTHKAAAEKKKKTTITAESFDHQVADKLGAFFEKTFLPAIKKLVEGGRTYDEVKKLLKISALWGAKITGEQFEERATARI